MNRDERERIKKQHDFRAWLVTKGLQTAEMVQLYQQDRGFVMVPLERVFNEYMKEHPDADVEYVRAQLKKAQSSYPGIRFFSDSPFTGRFESSPLGHTQLDDGLLLSIRGHADVEPPLESTEIWTPSETQHPPAAWLATAPGCLLLAADLLREGKALHELQNWRDFEELVAYLLEQDGWTVELTKPAKDDGVDVFAVKSDPELGPVQTLWQAKKYKPANRVGISCLRELAHVRDELGASKAFIVTTSFLTSVALAKVQRDEYRLGAREKPAVEAWVRRELGE